MPTYRDSTKWRSAEWEWTKRRKEKTIALRRKQQEPSFHESNPNENERFANENVGGIKMRSHTGVIKDTQCAREHLINSYGVLAFFIQAYINRMRRNNFLGFIKKDDKWKRHKKK